MEKPAWKPAGFHPKATLWAHILLLTTTLTRGVDYAVGEDPTSARRLGAVESSSPLWVWGAMFAAAAALGFTALAIRWTDGVILSHTLGTGLYAAVGVGIIWDAYQRAGTTSFDYGWATWIPAATLTICAVAWWKHRDTTGGHILAGAILALTVSESSVELDGLRNATILLAVAGLHAVMAAGTAQAREQADLIRKKVADAAN